MHLRGEVEREATFRVARQAGEEHAAGVEMDVLAVRRVADRSKSEQRNGVLELLDAGQEVVGLLLERRLVAEDAGSEQSVADHDEADARLVP